MALVHNQIVPATHVPFNEGKEVGLCASVSPSGDRENSSPAPRFQACPCDLQAGLGIAGDVFLTCLLAGSMGCLMKILLAKWILLEAIFLVYSFYL